MHSTKRVGILAALTAAAVLAAAAVAAETMVDRGRGTRLDQVHAAGTSGAAFEFTGQDGTTRNLPHARHRLVLREQALVIARFAAAIDCHGGPGGCEAPVLVLDRASGGEVVTELQGVRAIDSARSDGHDAQAVEQSATLPPGDYILQVRLETGVVPGGDPVTFNVAQWHFTVEAFV